MCVCRYPAEVTGWQSVSWRRTTGRWWPSGLTWMVTTLRRLLRSWYTHTHQYSDWYRSLTSSALYRNMPQSWGLFAVASFVKHKHLDWTLVYVSGPEWIHSGEREGVVHRADQGGDRECWWERSGERYKQPGKNNTNHQRGASQSVSLLFKWTVLRTLQMKESAPFTAPFTFIHSVDIQTTGGPEQQIPAMSVPMPGKNQPILHIVPDKTQCKTAT